MKVLYVTRNFLPGAVRGSELLSYRWAKAVAASGDESIVITSFVCSIIGLFVPFFGRFSKKEENIEGIQVIRIEHRWKLFTLAYIGTKLSGLLLKIPFLKKISVLEWMHGKTHAYASGVYFKGLEEAIRLCNPDIIHVTPLPQAYTVQTIQIVEKINKANSDKNKKIRLVLTPAMHFSDQGFSALYDLKDTAYAFKTVNCIACTTAYEKKRIMDSFHIPEDKIHVIPIGWPEYNNSKTDINTEAIPAIEEAMVFKADPSHIVLLFFGAKCYKKGLFNIVKALGMLEEGKDTFLLLVAGTPTLSWRIKLFMYRLQERYSFIIDLPYLSEGAKEKIYSISDIFTLPSIADSYGIVYLEAMMHGLPIVYADTPAQKEVVNDAGIVVPFYDIETMAEGLQKLIEDKKMRLSLGTKGIERYRKKYTEKGMMDSLVALYTELL